MNATELNQIGETIAARLSEAWGKELTPSTETGPEFIARIKAEAKARVEEGYCCDCDQWVGRTQLDDNAWVDEGLYHESEKWLFMVCDDCYERDHADDPEFA